MNIVINLTDLVHFVDFLAAHKSAEVGHPEFIQPEQAKVAYNCRKQKIIFKKIY